MIELSDYCKNITNSSYAVNKMRCTLDLKDGQHLVFSVGIGSRLKGFLVVWAQTIIACIIACSVPLFHSWINTKNGVALDLWNDKCLIRCLQQLDWPYMRLTKWKYPSAEMNVIIIKSKSSRLCSNIDQSGLSKVSDCQILHLCSILCWPDIEPHILLPSHLHFPQHLVHFITSELSHIKDDTADFPRQSKFCKTWWK